ncbi:uncharacterized protein BO72DRAFT_504057 [Aspergillus fijiensis CBS 313.89]|uniref:C2H2-type domain-containing protein n=1 Tax=Aspergillus fijiensis CBS 313.89 TaxID=1448319 RepID=A0A8G1RYD0_9EURO|nr:uncharacterized protein BO72DRAFT_504057 [Aspergillus fijiensis CBS 313.89]RAK79856.1 hypothetical protein BO72DRAFT_504057 [Aspergillus fijiensis CBS 313.89]
MPLESDFPQFFEESSSQDDLLDPWLLDEFITNPSIYHAPQAPPPSHLNEDFDLLWSQVNESDLNAQPSLTSQPPQPPSPLAVLKSPSSSSSESNSVPWTPADVYEIGYRDSNGDWRCDSSQCISNQVFLRACDLRKHYRSHQRIYFCQERDCPRSLSGFSSSKDCRRHMRSHRPTLTCPAAESLGCPRVFSRVSMFLFPSCL